VSAGILFKYKYKLEWFFKDERDLILSNPNQNRRKKNIYMQDRIAIFIRDSLIKIIIKSTLKLKKKRKISYHFHNFTLL